ncbi:SdrD B-like domain-containing protein [Candidatus Thiodictyon syntrophicum]|uniref:SD-repeat containing protein B domain-containing protein n=1 Tax=Candidatus Thiodictyon syntrophicum TaxID=1166950 RepID=A0A2K8UDV8_9GAMM|nr:SdrD B-like domain-containing protein [Candidatus Thiodictyon syntrophicum]AUB83783.1 hypothetical protein THSYN_24390 [Candidatus Thiodictyon syntrophicum]
MVAQPVFACATVGVCGTRTVDGNTADWNLTKDLYTSMREAGRTDKSQLGNFYFTYDSSTQTGYVLVLATGTNTVVQNTSDAWVKNYAAGNSPIPFTAFKWVVSNGKTVGYEASFTLAPGSYSQVEVHVQIASGRTCSTGKRSTPYSALITLKTPSCPTPPSSGGTAKCGTAVVDGSTAEWNTTATSPDLFSKLYQESTSLQTGNLFVRYDQATQTAYVLALTTTGYVAINYLPWNWVTLDGQTVVSATASNSASFAWVKNGTTLVGYEASFKLAPGTWQRLHAQLKTAPSNKTSNHFKATNGDQTLVANCGGGTGGTCTTGKSATVDGKITEWDLSADLLKPMVKEGTTTQTADLYVRYDTANNRAYVLTLARTGYVAINYLPWNFVKLNSVQVVTATDSTSSTTFRWVYNSAGKRIGYEASFALTAGSTANIFAQLKTAPASNTRSHFKSQASAAIDTVCAPLTYALGNQVYQENNGTAGYQATGTKADQPKAGVTVQLFQGTQLVATKTTGTDGCYLFDGLAAGSYSVVLPASQFATGAPLNALRASAIGFGGDTSTDDGSDHNGSQQVVDGDVRTNDYALGAGLQPLNERVSACTTTTPDANTNLTADLALEAKPPVVYGIGNRVWFENNGTPGYQPTGTDADTPAIGVPVELTGLFGGPAITTVTTGADGCYLFDNLAAGDYALRLSANGIAGSVLNGFVPVTPAGSGNIDDNADQNGTAQAGGDVTTAGYTLGLGKQPTSVTGAACTSYSTSTPTANLNLTADFAFQPAPVVKVALGNQVYKEVNGTAGYQATGANPDLPLKGVVVDLYDADGPTGKTATTGDDGCYLFDDLASGSYSAVLPANQFGATGALKGLRASAVGFGTSTTTDDSADHNGSQAAVDGSVASNTIALTPGNQPENERATACTTSLPDKNTNLTVDFALEDKPITEVAIGNRVWKDMDSDGKYTQGTDQPLSGVTVTVVDNEDATKVYTATTDGNGCYLVRGLSAGPYVAKILAGQSALNGLQGVSIDPDYALAGNDEVTDDSGDQNGVQYPDLGGDTQTAVYNLAPGTMPTNDASSAACGLASLPDANGVVLPNANVNETADFAFKEIPPPPVTVGIGDRVYFELNGTAGYQVGEDLPVKGVTVDVLPQGSSVPAKTVTTDDNGCYLAEGMDAGLYVVSLRKSLFEAGGSLFGYSPSPLGMTDIADQDEQADHNARWELNGQGATGAVVTQAYDLQPLTMPTSTGSNATEVPPTAVGACAGEQTLPDVNVNRTADLALSELVAVGNLLWEDKDSQDGFSSAGGDLGLDGVEVQLHRTDAGGNPLSDANGNPVVEVRSMTTQGGGFYLFDNLAPGYFVLKVPAKEFQDGGHLFGYTSLSGNGDGTADTDDDSGETTADENGKDPIDPTTDGIVSPVFELTAGYLRTGETGQRPSPAQAATNPGLFTNLQDYNTDLTRDLAVVKNETTGSELLGSIASTVFIDLNGNGRQDAFETGIVAATATKPGMDMGGIEVQLYRLVPNQDRVWVGTTFTNSRGEYLFSGLEEDTYQVVLPASQMTGGAGTLADKVRIYYGRVGGISNINEVQVLSTKDSAYLDNDVIRQDGDDNGLQTDGYGGEIASDPVVLSFHGEPVNAVDSNSPQVGEEFAQVTDPTSVGHTQDDAEDDSGDMTVDFGVVHQCYDVCDINRDGKVTQADDVDWIYAHQNQAPNPGQWAPGSGSCGGGATLSANNYTWCQSVANDQLKTK